MRKTTLRKSDVLREGYEKGLRRALDIINEMMVQTHGFEDDTNDFDDVTSGNGAAASPRSTAANKRRSAMGAKLDSTLSRLENDRREEEDSINHFNDKLKMFAKENDSRIHDIIDVGLELRDRDDARKLYGGLKAFVEYIVEDGKRRIEDATTGLVVVDGVMSLVIALSKEHVYDHFIDKAFFVFDGGKPRMECNCKSSKMSFVRDDKTFADLRRELDKFEKRVNKVLD